MQRNLEKANFLTWKFPADISVLFFGPLIRGLPAKVSSSHFRTIGKSRMQVKVEKEIVIFLRLGCDFEPACVQLASRSELHGGMSAFVPDRGDVLAS